MADDKPKPKVSARKRIGDVLTYLGAISLLVHGGAVLTGHHFGEPIDSTMRFGGAGVLILGLFVAGGKPKPAPPRKAS